MFNYLLSLINLENLFNFLNYIRVCFFLLIVNEKPKIIKLQATKKRHLSVTQNITECLDLSRDYQDIYIIPPLALDVKCFQQ